LECDLAYDSYVMQLTVYMLVMNLVVAMLDHPHSCTSFDFQLVAKVMSHLSTLWCHSWEKDTSICFDTVSCQAKMGLGGTW